MVNKDVPMYLVMEVNFFEKIFQLFHIDTIEIKGNMHTL